MELIYLDDSGNVPYRFKQIREDYTANPSKIVNWARLEDKDLNNRLQIIREHVPILLVRQFKVRKRGSFGHEIRYRALLANPRPNSFTVYPLTNRKGLNTYFDELDTLIQNRKDDIAAKLN